MPNWCHNAVTISGSIEDVTRVVQSISEKAPDESYLLRFSQFLPRPEGLDGGEACDWSVMTWGTKWDLVEDSGEFDLMLDSRDESLHASTSFSTAWGPPEEFFVRVAVRFPSVRISLAFDEPGMDFSGTRIINGTKVTGNDSPSKLAREWAAEDAEEED